MSEGALCGGGGGEGGALTRSRVSQEQLELLLSFMEEHVDFAAGKQSVYSRFSSSKLWRLLAERLNAAAAESGGARKSPDRWCRYWADIKYKARKKSAAGGALGDLSLVEERLRHILDAAGGGGGSGAGAGGGRRASPSDDERERKPMIGSAGLDDDMCSEASLGAGEGAGGARLSTEELLAEAAMRSALAAEKQAEAVAQGVELLRELVMAVRAGLAPPPAPPPPPPPPAPAPAPALHAHEQLDAHLHVHHHRL